MTDLGAMFDETLEVWSDIQGHLPYLVELAEDAEKVIELGTRGGVSTVAWLYGLEGHGHLWSVDINPAPPITFDHWTFVLGDDRSQRVMDQLPQDVDVVFVDTSHAYDHTLDELRLYHTRVKPGGVLLCHDTEVEYPEGIGPSIAFPVAQALDVFCDERGLTWVNHPHSYGLGVITL